MNKNKKQKIKGGFNNNLPITIVLSIIVVFIIFNFINNNNNNEKIKTMLGYEK